MSAQHAQRVLLFARELAVATKRERLLAARAARATGGSALGDDPLVTAADALLAKVAQGEALIKGLQGEALERALAGFDLAIVAAAAKQLEARVQARRPGTTPLGGPARTGSLAPPPAPHPGTQPLAPPARGLLDRLKSWSAPPPEAPPPPRPDPARQAFEAAYRFVQEVLAYVSPRLQLVRTAYDATGLPTRPKPWSVVGRAVQQAQVAAPEAPWLGHLAKAMLDDQRAAKEAQVALVRWDQAREVDARAQQVREAPQGFDTAAYRAAIFPLSHLHVAFRGLPTLSALFPPPAEAAPTPPRPAWAEPGRRE